MGFWLVDAGDELTGRDACRRGRLDRWVMKMGFLDNMQNQFGQGAGFLGDLGASLSHGTEAAGRAAAGAKLKVQLADAQRRRRDLLTQLGDSLYDATKDVPELRAG